MYRFQSWKDRRLRWDVIEWKTDQLSIKSFGRLWVPDINSDKYGYFF
uniref:Neur_chan_LBD domain-containing protein n=1 Tax=Angiostrongylus cantonensis TaxID=6313 RepID=A0A0K0DFS7_ANGCA